MKRAVHYATLLVVAHLLVSIAHGFAHHKLRIDLDPRGSAFVVAVVLILPLLALAMIWTASAKRLGGYLLSASMLASFFFGLSHHFLVMSPDHVRGQPPGLLGTTFVLTAYGLLVSEALGTYLGLHFVARNKPS
jgi:hypothetical protein